MTSLLAGSTIVLGGIVEGYGYGLSLGTNWPYTNNMIDVARKGDPEAIHRITATLTGILALVALILDPGLTTVLGLVAVAATALLGMATLYVLAGKLPSLFQGLHDIAAYTTFVIYLLLFAGFRGNLLTFFEQAVLPPHFLYFVIFMGGWVTGTRKMRKPIGDVRRPKGRLQWVWVVHGLAAGIFVISLILLHYWLTLGVAVLEGLVGLLVYRTVNSNPEKPGASIALHQLFSILTVVAILLNSGII
ncbi:hypothetical protein HS1genome_0770 [Sulfodiicoccus acidiphilus]|uniref:Cytochrome C oxidase assembly protein n=1 Tax=Sulfodiicoccus acidiphilus TaxID=1670455 RepID=A0A348B2H9_9CREN|nr:hypothetical protein HS1genome_0770 [Sulfodiicoccus acidiphilus]GGT97507.1 hypothetical protein GCM10007116_13850 [Sulfodiicoccus acidiphilus]